MKKIIIAGTHSGCGKTTVTCALLSALKNRGLSIAPFKCGPDYIDPMFHKRITGNYSHNLDRFFCDDNTLNYILHNFSQNADISVIEGVMGFYDGGETSVDSISEVTGTPVIIVINCRGMSDSIGAVVNGFLNYRKPGNIAGFIFNNLSEKLIPLAKQICEEQKTTYFGSLPPMNTNISSRHLGLVFDDYFDSQIDKLGDAAEKYIDIDALLKIESDLENSSFPEINKYSDAPVIAAARDDAFSFIYDENFRLLEEMNCRIKYFSPLEDVKLPDADGLILCGGYPELYAERLSRNTAMLRDIHARISSGMPTIAECGGFMYLHENIEDENGNIYPMAGIIPGKCFPLKKLCGRFGYITMTANDDNILCRKGQRIKAHEFHYWESSNCGSGFSAEKSSGRKWDCCHVPENLYAGFPHLYFYSDIKTAENFVEKCIVFGGRRGTDK